MQNGQLKPAYNAQISTENQFIVNYTIHQETNDFNTLKRHLENFEKLFGKKNSENWKNSLPMRATEARKIMNYWNKKTSFHL